MDVLHAIAQAITNNELLSVILLFMLLGGAGERVSHLLEQRRRAAMLKAEMKAANRKNSRLVELLRSATDTRALIGGVQNGDVAALAKQASQALSERTELLTLLHQVQAADRAWPQLPPRSPRRDRYRCRPVPSPPSNIYLTSRQQVGRHASREPLAWGLPRGLRRINMTTFGDQVTTNRVEVIVRAMVGHGEQLLLIRHRNDDHWLLPGGPVEPGEPTELALRRRIDETLSTKIKSASFLAVVEHCYRDQQGNDHHAMDLVFDVTLADLDVQCVEDDREVQWTPWEELSAIDLRPVGLRAGLRSGRLTTGDRWLPWRPSAVP